MGARRVRSRRPSAQLAGAAAKLVSTAYRVIEGRRQAKAIKQLAEKGQWPLPARMDALVITDGASYSDLVRAGMALALHAARSASPVSELHATEEILEAGGEEAATVKRIAEQTGMPIQTVRRRLKLRSLSRRLRAAFENGQITVTVAEAAARLSSEQQQALERAADAGERITLPTVKAASRPRTAKVASELDGELFAERQTPWLATVRGHMRAALDAIPAAQQQGELADAIASAIERAESGSETLA